MPSKRGIRHLPKGDSSDIIWFAGLPNFSISELRFLQMRARAWREWHQFPAGDPPYSTSELIREIEKAMLRIASAEQSR